MATRVGKFSKRAQESTLGHVFDEVMRDAEEVTQSDLGYEIDFITSPQGLNVQLYPAQRIIVKAAFGIPLDYKESVVPVWDVMKENLLYQLSETDFVKMLYDQGRCNIEDWRDIPPKGFRTIVLYAGRRGGKLLWVDEPIPTPGGFKRNGDLVDGDFVFGEDGKPWRIQYAHPVEEVEAFKVSFDDGTFTYAHAGHLWRTYTYSERKNPRRHKAPPVKVPTGMCGCGCGLAAPRYTRASGIHKKGDPYRYIRSHHHRTKRASEAISGGVRTTEEIRATLKAVTSREESNHAIKVSEPVNLPAKELPVDPYCLGIWLGAGNSDCGIITADDNDGAVIKQYFEAAGFSFTKMSSGRYRWSVRGIYEPLRILGVLNNKHIPKDYLWASYAQRLALLQGLMDSDGTCGKDGGAEFTNCDETLAHGVYHLAASLGLKPHWGEGVATLNGEHHGPKYRVHWTAVLPVFRLPRKVLRLPKKVRPATKWRYITAVEPVGKMRMRCIATENPTHLYLFGLNFNVTHNSQVVSGIGASQLRNLLAIASPQQYYKLVEGSEVNFTLMGTDEDSSDRLYQKLRADVNGSPFFKPYIRNNDEQEMRFVTQADRDNRDVLSSISVKSYTCTTRSARGPSNYFLALDEFQFFRPSKDTNSADLYKAATPSTSQFAPPDDPEVSDSKVLVISSPATKVGKMFELHQTALSEGVGSNIFTMRLSTVEMNPRIPRSSLAQELKENPDTFKAEFGGEFLDGSGSYVPEFKFNACIDMERKNQTHFNVSAIGRKFFWGLDLAMKRDGTALAIGHLEVTEGRGIELIFDYVDRMIVGEAFTGPGVIDGERVKSLKELDLIDIVSWLFHMHQILPCFKGLTDQHAGAHFKQLLQLNGITAMELVHLNDQINSKMYWALQGFINHEAARFPHDPSFETEFKQLEASFINKYVLRVEAPSEKGAHDDRSDACAIVAMLAQTWLEEEGNLDLDPTARVLQVNPLLNPNQPIIDPNGVSMRDIQMLDRTRRIQQMATLGADMIGMFRQGRHGRHGRRY